MARKPAFLLGLGGGVSLGAVEDSIEANSALESAACKGTRKSKMEATARRIRCITILASLKRGFGTIFAAALGPAVFLQTGVIVAKMRPTGLRR